VVAKRQLAVLFMIVLGLAFQVSGSQGVASADERGHVFGSAMGQQGTGQGEFGKPAGVAVDESTHQVYVVDSTTSRVEVFGEDGVFQKEFSGCGAPASMPAARFSEPSGIAVDNSSGPADLSRGDIYVVDTKNETVDKFTVSGECIARLTGVPETPHGKLSGRAFEKIWGVAVDSSGDAWVDFENKAFEPKRIARFNDEVTNGFVPDESLEEALGGSDELFPGLGVNSKGDIYYKDVSARENVDEVKELNGDGQEINRFAPADWLAVESLTGDVYLGEQSKVVRVSSAGEEIESFGLGHLTSASGVAVDSSTGTVYVADSVRNVVDVFPLEPPGPPTVTGSSVEDIASTSATFAGRINPRGAKTEYSFEYGRCSSETTCQSSGYEGPFPIESLAAGFDSFVVSVHPQDLVGNTSYHVRLVAHNGIGSVVGEEKTFVTNGVGVGGVLSLPDGRSWELVSPADAHGARPLPIGAAGVAQSSLSGNGMTYVVKSPDELEPRGSADLSQVLASRTSNGWVSRDIALSHDVASGLTVGIGFEYRQFSEELDLSVVEPHGPFSPQESDGVSESSPEATERTPYVRHNNKCSVTSAMPGCYKPIVTGAPEENDVVVGTKFGGNPQITAVGDTSFVDATPNIEHVVLQSSVGLTSQSAPTGGLYVWSSGSPATERLELVSVLPLPNGKAAGHADLGDPGGGQNFARHAISDDGNRIFFAARESAQSNQGLYVHDTVLHKTIRLDVAEGGSTVSQPDALFQTASSDGSKVFFTDQFPLTAGSGSGDLYECDLAIVQVSGSGKLSCGLSDVTPVPKSGEPGAGESAVVQDGVLGASEDGSYVYFVANGVQAEGAIPGNCGGSGASKSETCNLYVRHAGKIRLVAIVSGDDASDWGGTGGTLVTMSSRVSPSGEWLAFMSDRSLTGYDNRDVKSGFPDEEVFLYNSVTGRLVCASCNPTGGRPLGVEYMRINGQLVGGSNVMRPGQWVAANVPGWTPYRLNSALYQSRYLSNSGRLFFDSSDALVAQDTNSNEDVYEFEPAGVGGCSSGAMTFVPGVGGCMGLISSGVDFGESAFLDASGSGGDVFFLTTEKLVTEDVGKALNVYDAHECSASAPCPPAPVSVPPECLYASSCRSAPMVQPPFFGAPSSATFSGAGNVSSVGKGVVKPKVLTRGEKLARALRLCRKQKAHKQRSACERQAHKRYRATKALMTGPR
jgi:DNA-binding beta-propeller fold protein YncE